MLIMEILIKEKLSTSETEMLITRIPKLLKVKTSKLSSKEKKPTDQSLTYTSPSPLHNVWHLNYKDH